MAAVAKLNLTKNILGYEGVKLLGVPAIPYKSSELAGDLIGRATTDLLKIWDCDKKAAYMIFDTTSANTGHVTAGCISVQDILKRPLLWVACRHHIGEVILTSVWDALSIETAKSPEISLFERLRNSFNSLSYGDLTNINKELVDESEESKNVVRIIDDVMNSKTFAYRGDYTRFLKLVRVILTGNIDNFAFFNIGAISKARWMGKTIGAANIFLLSDKIKTELPKGSLATDHQLQQIQRFVQFVALVYCKWWVRCPLSASAPINDLDLITALENYPDELISEAALKAVKRHLWYLTQEMVPLSLFSHELSNLKKNQLSKAILKSQNKNSDELINRHGTSYGKPNFPVISENKKNRTLVSFVGADSMGFFRILHLNSEFLKHPSSKWSEMESYKLAKRTVNSMLVVNDAAERGVKLANDFIDSAKIEKNYQTILQVVENDRHLKPNQRKKDVKSKSWYLTL